MEAVWMVYGRTLIGSCILPYIFWAQIILDKCFENWVIVKIYKS